MSTGNEAGSRDRAARGSSQEQTKERKACLQPADSWASETGGTVTKERASVKCRSDLTYQTTPKAPYPMGLSLWAGSTGWTTEYPGGKTAAARTL